LYGNNNKHSTCKSECLHFIFPCTGSYEVKNYGSFDAISDKAAKPSSAFRQANYVDRFGRSLVS
jgi:hypothetical protein